VTSKPAVPLWPGDRYAPLGVLGQGGAAIVYRARDRTLDRDVAIKVLRDEFQLSRAWERFAREIDALERLHHPHIVPILGSGLTETSVYYVMPLAEGGTLEDRLRRDGPMAISDVRRLAAELTAALTCAHEHGVVHRDVKPSNILLSGGHYWLADFGIVHLLQEAEAARFTPSGITLGSREYMSPEQLFGQADIDHRTDLYSLGLVLYECLAGIHAFPARTTEASARMRLVNEPIPVRAHRPDVDGELATTVMKALRGDAEERWSSAREMWVSGSGL
jgi:serine/threonine-protein kinase